MDQVFSDLDAKPSRATNSNDWCLRGQGFPHTNIESNGAVVARTPGIRFHRNNFESDNETVTDKASDGPDRGRLDVITEWILVTHARLAVGVRAVQGSDAGRATRDPQRVAPNFQIGAHRVLCDVNMRHATHESNP